MMYLSYLWMVLKHKYYVFIECYKLKIPFRGLIHDLRNLSILNYYNYNKNKDIYLLNNIHKNKYDWHYWIGTDNIPIEMPEKYVKEMVAEIKAISFETIGYDDSLNIYINTMNKMNLHPNTRRILESLLFYTDKLDGDNVVKIIDDHIAVDCQAKFLTNNIIVTNTDNIFDKYLGKEVLLEFNKNKMLLCKLNILNHREGLAIFGIINKQVIK